MEIHKLNLSNFKFSMDQDFVSGGISIFGLI
jgi:hypothetical protein